MSRHGSAPARPALSGGVSLVVREETTKEHSLGGFERPRGCEQCTDEGTQKPLEPAQEQAEVVAGNGEHGVDAVAVAAFEVIATYPALGLDVPNDRLDRGAAAYLAADRKRQANWIIARRTRSLPALAKPFSRRRVPLSSGAPVKPPY